MTSGAARWLVSGRVQGVGFRWFTQRQAEQLGLAGWARNLPDGRVEVVARGSAGALASLSEWLAQGPPTARVENVEMTDIPHEAVKTNVFCTK